MRKLPLLFSMLLLFSFTDLKNPLTEKERKFANDFLSDTQKTLIETTKGLSDAQLKFRSAPDRWSVEDCVKHIAMAEMGLRHMTDSIINTPANPEKRNEIKMNEDQIITMITDRSFKAKAPEQLQPQNTPFKSYQEAIESFNGSRQKLIDYVNTTDQDLRDHVVNFPMGLVDAYQVIIFIGAHSKRHTLQIKEVMADPAFPKK